MALDPKYQIVKNNHKEKVYKNGRFYTWFVVNDDRCLCPEGWHVPTNEEWTTFIDYLIANGYAYGSNPESVAKSIAMSYDWQELNYEYAAVGNAQENNNTSGFSAFPAGRRDVDGGFYSYGGSAAWWSSSEFDDIKAWMISIFSFSTDVDSSPKDKKTAMPVRCVKDE